MNEVKIYGSVEWDRNRLEKRLKINGITDRSDLYVKIYQGGVLWGRRPLLAFRYKRWQVHDAIDDKVKWVWIHKGNFKKYFKSLGVSSVTEGLKTLAADQRKGKYCALIGKNKDCYVLRTKYRRGIDRVIVGKGASKVVKEADYLPAGSKELQKGKCAVAIGKRKKGYDDEIWAPISKEFTREYKMWKLVEGIPYTLQLLAYHHRQTPGREKHYFVTERCAGDLLKTEKSFIDEHKHSIARQVIEAVAGMNNKGLIHCDLKPNNVLLTKEGEVRLCDFGAMRKTSKDDENARSELATLYVSPEIANGVKYSALTLPSELTTVKLDSWGLGLLLFRLLSSTHEDLISNGDGFPLDIWNATKNFTEETMPSYLAERLKSAGVTDSKYVEVIKGLLEINPDKRWTSQQAFKAFSSHVYFA